MTAKPNKAVRILPTVLPAPVTVPVAPPIAAPMEAPKPPPKPAPDPEGVRCPVCHCDHCPTVFSVKGRDQLGAFTRRQRQCRHCGKKFNTRERPM